MTAGAIGLIDFFASEDARPLGLGYTRTFNSIDLSRRGFILCGQRFAALEGRNDRRHADDGDRSFSDVLVHSFTHFIRWILVMVSESHDHGESKRIFVNFDYSSCRQHSAKNFLNELHPEA